MKPQTTNRKSQNFNAGVTMLELLVAVGIITMISALMLAALNDFRARKTIDAAVEEVTAAFAAAHLDTISSKNDRAYGVHIDPDKVVYFIGPTYDETASTNKIYALPQVIEIVNVSLAGGANEVLFARLTGTTSQYGTFNLRAKNKPSVAATITVNGTGAISL